MHSIKGLENQRWFIWTIVSIFVILGGLAAYIYYVTSLDSSETADTQIASHIFHKPKKVVSGYYNVVSIEPEYKKISIISTADWKTYTNQKFAFSFKYPEDFSVIAESRPYAGIISFGVNPKNWASQTWPSEAVPDNCIEIYTENIGFNEATWNTTPYPFIKRKLGWVLDGRQGDSDSVVEIKANSWHGLEGTTTYEITSADGSYGGTGYVYEAVITNNSNTQSVFFTMGESGVSKDIFDTMVSNFVFSQ